MRSAAWHMAVLIPARNEEVLLPRCLASVQKARLRLPFGVTSDVVLVADCCSDATRRVGQSFLGKTGAVICTEVGCVGSARALAAERALARYEGPLDRCWLANTDADCDVPDDWLVKQLRLAMRDVAAVTGVVAVDSFREHCVEVRERFRRSYRIEADGTHPHVHGANLGVRADAYAAVGGWGAMATAEDHDLWNRLVDGGWPCSSYASLQVVTSGRRVGRAPLGFAGALAAHNEALA